MTEFLAATLAYPTVLFTILLAVVIIYWLFVVVGALDMDFLDVQLDLDGVADGALGGLDGAGDAAASHLDGVGGHIDGAAGHVDGAAGHGDAADGAAEGGFAMVLSALGLRGVPLTVSLSFVVLWSWLFTFLGMEAFGGLATGGVLGVAVATVVALGALGVSLAVTRLAIKPLQRFFVTHHSKDSLSLVGEVCTISTSRVDDTFGQAELEDGGAGLLIQVRCIDSGEPLRRGVRALIVDYDGAQGVFHVVPYEALLED